MTDLAPGVSSTGRRWSRVGRLRRGCVLWLCLVLGSACEPGLDTRTALLVQTLVDADRDLIATRPALVAQKYAAMAIGTQPFLRGTAALFYRDVGRYRGESAALLHGEGGEAVQLYGDPHLENIGAVVDASGVLLDGVDFDATLRGPFAWDVRRAALALRTALSLGGLVGAVQDSLVAALLSGYLDGLPAAPAPSGVGSAEPAPLRISEPSLGRIAQELLADAEKRQQSRQELSEYTQRSEQARYLQRSETLIDLPPPWRDELADPARARALLMAYRATRRGGPGQDAQFEVLDAVQRLGSGIASLPNLRFWVLLRGDGGPDGVWILEFKEQRDPPQPAALLGSGPRSRNAQRVWEGADCLLSSPTAEPDLGQVTWGGVSFLVRRVLRSRRDLDVAKLAERLQSGRYEVEDAQRLAFTLGRLLANGHRRCGGASLAALLPSASDRERFVVDLTLASALDHERLLHDWARFQVALSQRGPLLGARLP